MSLITSLQDCSRVLMSAMYESFSRRNESIASSKAVASDFSLSYSRSLKQTRRNQTKKDAPEQPEKPEQLAAGAKQRNPIANVTTTEMRFMAYEDLQSARLICAHRDKQGEWRFHQVETNPPHLLH